MNSQKNLTSGELPYLTLWQNISKQAVTHTTYIDRAPYLEDNGIKWKFEPPLEFTNTFQCTLMSEQTMLRISEMLDGIQSMTIGGWFYCHRTGEQTFFCRGVPVVAPAEPESVFSRPPMNTSISVLALTSMVFSSAPFTATAACHFPM